MNSNDFFIKENKKMVKVMLADILYIESFKDYMCFHCTQKMVKVRIPLWSVEERLDKANFLRVHKSFIINLNHIDSFTSTYIEIKEAKIPVGRTYRKEVSELLNKQINLKNETAKL